MSLSKIKRKDLTFEDEIGRGGYSTVYRTKWQQEASVSTYVAAKHINRPDQHELQVMSKLEHENIVKLLGVVDEKPDFFLILELCDGGSLRNYLNSLGGKGKRLPTGQFGDWAEQAARPLEYLRKQGILHKDVKSNNYVIAANNVLKLTDFGLAKRIEATIENATQRGTPGYMAQELLKEFILSPSFDIFSYGIVLWELFTTEVPFKGDDPNHVKYKMCANHARPPIPDDCPKEIADLMRQCWQEDWKRRPSIEDVLVVIRKSTPSIKGQPGHDDLRTSKFDNPDIPGVPGNPQIHGVLSNAVIVSWIPPDFDGGSPILGYSLECRKDPSQHWSKCNSKKIDLQPLSYIVTGLDRNSRYQFRVAAENKIGLGPYSESDIITTLDETALPPGYTLPDTWTDMNDDERYKLVELDMISAEYNSVADKFMKSCATDSVLGSPVTPTIVKIERLQNKMLYWRYITILDEAKRRMPGRDDLEDTLYHGSSKEVIEDVGQMGFDSIFTHAPTNATAYGKGTYFAKHASSSVYYAKKDPATQHRHMYMCKALIGDYTVGKENMIVPPRKPDSDERYDCIVDDIVNPQIFVIFLDWKAYPEYLITFIKQ